MSEHNLTFPIVGMFHRPPALSITKRLPLNTNLYLHSEPWNQHDPNAIAVCIDLKFAQQILIEGNSKHKDVDLTNYGNNQFQLGYLPAADAALLNYDRNLTILGQFKLDQKGKPMVKLVSFQQP